MSMQTALRRGLLAFPLMLGIAGAGWAQGSTGHVTAANMKEMKFSAFPGMPACSTASVQSGDPKKGPSIVLAKAEAGCTVPWHWHTPNEQLMMVSGTAHVDMKDGKTVTLQTGGFAQMPSRHVHRFRCGITPCVLYVHSDAAFDMHYVDGEGKEIPADQALQAGKKTAAKQKK